MIKRLTRSVFHFHLRLPSLHHRPYHPFLQTKLTQPKLNQLSLQYKLSPSLTHFQPYITTNSDYFKIFQLIEKEPYTEEVYRAMRELTGKLETQNDNMRLLRAKVVARIAEYCAKEGRNQEAEALYNEAMEILEDSLIPQVLQYYSIYRKYGLFLQSIGQTQQAAEILSQSVQIMRQYVKMSDDPVTANYHSIQQAKACIKLLYLQPQHRQKWLTLANEYWRECEKGIYEQIEYAQTVIENYRDRLKTDPARARIYAEDERNKIKDEAIRGVIEGALGEIGKK